MTCKVAFMWELGWNTPIKEADLWIYPLRDFGVDNMYATPVSGIKNKYIKEFHHLEEILEQNKDCEIVWCHEAGTTKLDDFDHPENALYIFGKTNWSPFLTLGKDEDLSVRIETKMNAGLLWGSQAASIILHDRLIRKRKK